ncbi:MULTISPECIES: hypothetical protein [unclassified Pseudoalteromonas]|uniref:hypothetical protein n=1 Tax=unclassified Pseudoalteromonas TaxID=194690 RepID=UPI003014F7A8
MVSSIKARIALIAAVLVASAGVFSFDNNNERVAEYAACSCSTSQFVADSEACQPESHTSWVAWLTGGSSNGQFHYLDLLELLIGSNDEQNSSKVSSPY